MSRRFLHLLRIFLIITFIATCVGIGVLYREIKIVPSNFEKREAIVTMLEVIFLGGTLFFIQYLSIKYLERKAI